MPDSDRSAATAPRSLYLADPAVTDRLGEALALNLPPAAVVVHLQGPLGAGKSSTARALLRALGVTGTIRSPTYTLVERYDTVAGEALHLDLYRLADPAELAFLGLDEALGRARLWLVEWPERGRGALPQADLLLRLSLQGQGRRVQLEPQNAAAAAWVESVAAAMEGSDTALS